MVGVIFVYVDSVFGFYGYFFLCSVGCFSMIIWTPAVLSVSYRGFPTRTVYLYYNKYIYYAWDAPFWSRTLDMHVFCIFVFAPVQRSWACFTWKGALEVCSLLLLSLQLMHTCVQNWTQKAGHQQPYMLRSAAVVLAFENACCLRTLDQKMRKSSKNLRQCILQI